MVIKTLGIKSNAKTKNQPFLFFLHEAHVFFIPFVLIFLFFVQNFIFFTFQFLSLRKKRESYWLAIIQQQKS
jgi:hypothetical protein